MTPLATLDHTLDVDVSMFPMDVMDEVSEEKRSAPDSWILRILPTVSANVASPSEKWS
eukprot:CAMPEP_0114110196 /NCGR_PEP_ID=MMETSP0043_2-20121206/1184_1 /TAXON_ID=464988 /ORGANISM="Hemiselmis andersenii, Strain CCMP644" /LENGTH=57 /DNA_ID=CAMNT_0001202131 /DNA_START=368 /DNA_END=541 /DNA_ORIENTATION=+